MAINANDEYTKLTLVNNYKIIWESQLILSGDTVAGLLAGYLSVLAPLEISKNIAMTFDNYITKNFWSIKLYPHDKPRVLLNNYLLIQKYRGDYIDLNFVLF